jgi:hypothetical protein
MENITSIFIFHFHIHLKELPAVATWPGISLSRSNAADLRKTLPQAGVVELWFSTSRLL